MRKIMTIVGTRPELIKMSRVITMFDQYTQHILVHTGQNFDFELNQIFFNDLGIRAPDYFLAAQGKNAAQTIARIIEKTDEVLEIEKPDAIMIYGDTNSCLSVIAAKRRHIPIFHMEAGNRSFDARTPEELNRKIVDHISDINIVLTEHSRRYLLAEGIAGDRIIKVGSHLQEVLTHFMPQINISTILEKLNLMPHQYFLVSAHREENVDNPHHLADLLSTLHALINTYHLPIIVSTHPRTQKHLAQKGIEQGQGMIRFLKPFGFFDYIKLQIEAYCVLSDSGTITEEASLLNLAAITLRDAHERPEGMDEGTLIMSGLKTDQVLDAVKVVTTQHHRLNTRHHIVPDYQGGLVSQKILRIVLSYIDFIKRTVWYESTSQS